jgi:hypothetical protein
MEWMAAADSYGVALADGQIVCRTTGGKVLKSVPKSVKETDAALSLRQLREWLNRHESASASSQPPSRRRATAVIASGGQGVDRRRLRVERVDRVESVAHGLS